MLKKQLKIGFFIVLLSYGAAFTACHSSVKKEALKNISKKDTVKADIKPKVNPLLADFFVALNAVDKKKDTLKVYRYANGLIRCSLNSLSDTITTSNHLLSWKDIDWIVDGDGNNESIFIPDGRNPLTYILNDTMLFINVIDHNGRVNLFLLNRTKTSLKFARGTTNPICNLSTYVYVDLKHNTILNHDNQYTRGHNRLTDVGNSDAVNTPLSKDIYSMAGWNIPQYYPESTAPYFIHRYKIVNKNFVQTDVDTSFFKIFSKIDINYPDGAKLFYHTIATSEHWEHDKFIPHD